VAGVKGPSDQVDVVCKKLRSECVGVGRHGKFEVRLDSRLSGSDGAGAGDDEWGEGQGAEYGLGLQACHLVTLFLYGGLP